MNSPHYSARPSRGTLHVHVCEDCGAERMDPKRPGSTQAPKLCAECNRWRQQKILSGLFGRECLEQR